MSEAYPRDLVGYGRNPPLADWPGEARVAVQFVLNYEEGGESCVLHGDEAEAEPEGGKREGHRVADQHEGDQAREHDRRHPLERDHCTGLS